MQLKARSLPVVVPCLTIGAEDAVPEHVTDEALDVLPLGKVGELGLKNILEVGGVGSHNTLKVAEPWTLEGECAICSNKHVGSPLVGIASNADEQRGKHPKDRPYGKAMAPPLAKGVDDYKS